jgi:uroporphyrinogen III methyltransferase/synthase
MSQSSKQGKVYLVGAGPGDPGLITVLGARLLAEADTIVYDALANPALLDLARPDAQMIDVGKRARHHKLPQEQINQLLAEHALAGEMVVRLKGGDPFVFGRGSEEAMHLHEHGVAVQVVPGLTSGAAGPAYAGIPITHRQVATSCSFITGHEDPDKPHTQTDYAALSQLAKAGGTLCFYMGMGQLPRIVEQLTGLGLSGQTPAAIVQWATTPRQRSLRSTVSRIVDDAAAAGLGAPAIVVIGQVVGLDPNAMNWFERRPLFGQTIVVTRTRAQASQLRQALEQLGAAVIEAPTIQVDPPDDWQPVLDQVRQVHEFDWLVLTSVNGVAGLADAMNRLELDARHLARVKLAVVGQATGDALRSQLGIRPDFVPPRSTSQALAERLIAAEAVENNRILLLRADIAPDGIVETFTQAGADVVDLPIYHTRTVDALPDELIDALENHEVDWVTFTSSSTARNLVDLLGDRRALLDGVKLASIGPMTSQMMQQLDLPVTLEARQSDIDGLVGALARHVAEAESPSNSR